MECSDDEEDAEEENFFRRERFSPARVRWRGAEATDGVLHAFPFLFPGFSFLGGPELEETINIELLSSQKKFLPMGVWARQRRGLEILMW